MGNPGKPTKAFSRQLGSDVPPASGTGLPSSPARFGLSCKPTVSVVAFYIDYLHNYNEVRLKSQEFSWENAKKRACQLQSSLNRAYIFISRTFPFFTALLLNVPSIRKPAFSSTRQDAVLQAKGYAKIRRISVFSKTWRQSCLTALAPYPFPQYGSPR